MYKKTMTYEDYNGVTRTEDFYFNLSKAELLELELSTEGGYEQLLSKIIKTKDQVKLIKIFKDLILMTYGEKSPDGRKFVKNEELRQDFMQTEAYSDLFMLLASDDKEAAAFVNGIIPQSLRDQISKDELDKARKDIENGTFTGIETKDQTVPVSTK